MDDLKVDILAFLGSLFAGGGVGWIMVKMYIKSVVEDTVGPEIEEIRKNYVMCNVCQIQHNNLNSTLDEIRHNVALLVERAIK